jgi:hypothetical protein
VSARRDFSRAPTRRRERRWLSLNIEALARQPRPSCSWTKRTDFADDNCLSLSGRQPNVLVTRTFSKGYGLAGLRFIRHRRSGSDRADGQGQNSYNCDAIAIAAACCAR